MRTRTFLVVAVIAAVAIFVVARLIGSAYLFFAGYVVLQYVVIATAWNILGGYAGYVNFGSSGFFGIGAYSSVVLYQIAPQVPLPLFVVIGGLVSGAVGLGMGYLTLRLRGVFFAIATLALAVVIETLIVNWRFVGGGEGTYVIRPASVPVFGDYIHYLFAVMLALSVIAVTTARAIEKSELGLGFATIRDDEVAAEALGVPTLRLKLLAATLSGALMGMAGAPFPYYIAYIQPAAAFALDYGVNAIAMPMIGGTRMWVGPVVGAVVLATLQQLTTVTISSAVNLLIVGMVLIVFVVAAPKGIVGLVQDLIGRRRQ